MLSHDCKIRVWYKHTDQMAICHHSNYICYYEAARSELLRELGMSFAEVERRGIMMPILEVQSKYRKPAYFDELLTVRIILREKPAARINFFYEIYNERGELINTGMTQLGFIHSDTRRPCRCPEWFLALLDTAGRSDLLRPGLRGGCRAVRPSCIRSPVQSAGGCRMAGGNMFSGSRGMPLTGKRLCGTRSLQTEMAPVRSL